MRTLTLLIMLFLITTAFGQERQLSKAEIFDKIYATMAVKLSEYKCIGDKDGDAKTSNDSLFRHQFRKIFSTVILSSSDIVSNGSAFSYAQNKENTKLSINNTFLLSKNHNKLLDIGINIDNKDGIFNYYSKNAMSNKVGLKIGIILPFGKSTQLFPPDECAKLIPERTEYMQSKRNQYKDLLHLEITDLEYRKTELKRNIEQQSYYTNRDTTNYFKELDKIENKLDQHKKFINLNDLAIKKLVNNDLAVFDSIHNIFTGYQANWVNLSTNFINDAFGIGNDSIIANNNFKKNDNLFKFEAEASLNRNVSTKGYFYFLQLNTKLNRGSFLDEPSLKNTKISVKEITTTIDGVPTITGFNVLSDERIIGNYENLEAPLMQMDIGLYGACLFLFKKTLGFSLRGTINFPASDDLNYHYQQNYSALLGLIFRMATEEDFTKATVSVNAGFENSPYKTNAWDSFIVKASVGVPFNIFTKSKSK